MKSRDIAILKQKPRVEWEQLLREYRDKVQTMRFDLQAGKVKNAQELREAKRMIARILTFLQEGERQPVT